MVAVWQGPRTVNENRHWPDALGLQAAYELRDVWLVRYHLQRGLTLSIRGCIRGASPGGLKPHGS